MAPNPDDNTQLSTLDRRIVSKSVPDETHGAGHTQGGEHNSSGLPRTHSLSAKDMPGWCVRTILPQRAHAQRHP